MVKQIELIKRKQGLSPQEFSSHYEEVFAPLMLRSSPTIKRYVRNYVARTLAGGEPNFDCVTELWFDNVEGLEANIKVFMSEKGKVIRDNLKEFVDSSRTIAIIVDERVSDLP
jgi:uncharacterized protein (TIGR02118 family)